MKRLIATTLAVFSLVFAASAEDTATLEASGLAFKHPATWTKVPSASAMRLATLEVKAEGDAQPMQMGVFAFNAAGGVQANVDRWLKQFSPEPKPETKVEELDAGGTKVTLVTATGTFNDMMSGKGTQENTSLLGAIIPAGENNVFLKLTGPKDSIAKVAEEFKKMAVSPFAK